MKFTSQLAHIVPKHASQECSLTGRSQKTPGTDSKLIHINFYQPSCRGENSRSSSQEMSLKVHITDPIYQKLQEALEHYFCNGVHGVVRSARQLCRRTDSLPTLRQACVPLPDAATKTLATSQEARHGEI